MRACVSIIMVDKLNSNARFLPSRSRSGGKKVEECWCGGARGVVTAVGSFVAANFARVWGKVKGRGLRGMDRLLLRRCAASRMRPGVGWLNQHEE